MNLLNILIGKRNARNEYLRREQDSFVSRWARPPSRNISEWLEMFAKSPRLAVVDRIASDLATVPGHLYQVERDGTKTEVTVHRFLDFMAQPNPLYEMTSAAIWRLQDVYLELAGESFLLIERDKDEKPKELWPVPPHWVKSTPYLGNPYYQILSPGGISMWVPVEDMFVMKQLNPYDPFWRGLGPAESIADEVEIDEYAAQFQKRFFYNDATPPVVFSMPDATPEQRDAFLARWNQKHRGVENSHRAAALSGNVTVTELGTQAGKNLGFLESRIAMRDAVLEHFGVPREIMGITENSNRATADSAQYIYAKNVLTPRLRSREAAINTQLLPLFGDNLEWHYDAMIPYDKEFNKERAIDGWNSGLIMRNEARRLLDLPDVEGGDVFRTSVSDVFVGEGEDPTKVTQALLSDGTEMRGESGKKAAQRINVNAMLLKEAAAERRNISAFEVAITRHFQEQRNKITRVLGLDVKADFPEALADLDQFLTPEGDFDPELWALFDEAQQQKVTEAVAAGLLNWKDEARKLNQSFTPLWKQAYDDGAALNQEVYGLNAIQRPEFVTAAKINGGQRVTKIEQTTKDAIAGIIARGVADGIGQKELRRLIQDEMSTTQSRAKLIARQETATALATGQFDMMRSAGATMKTWHHRPQKNPRDGVHSPVNHVALEGETVPINDEFSNGLRYPRDPDDGRPEEVINCRCYLTYDFMSQATGAEEDPVPLNNSGIESVLEQINVPVEAPEPEEPTDQLVPYMKPSRENDMIRGVSKEQIDKLRGTREHKGYNELTVQDIIDDYGRVGININAVKAQEIREAVFDFTAGSFTDMREAFMAHRDGKELDDYQTDMLNLYMKATEYARIGPTYESQGKELFRGIQNKGDDYAKRLLALTPGDTFDLEMASSFSSTRKCAESFAESGGILIHINGNDIINAPSIRGMSQYDFEDEVLVDDRLWLVTKVEEDESGQHNIWLRRK